VGSITWLKLAREHARAKEQLEKGAPEAMQVFYNTRLALSWANTLEQTSARELMERTRVKPRELPDWALVVTIAVDTQANRLEVQAHAWGAGLEHAVIDYQVFMGSPTAAPEQPGSVWQRLDEYRATPWLHASGVLIQASAYGIDTGGQNTQDVYNYCSGRTHVGCLAIHGSSRPNRPIIGQTPTKQDIDWNGKRVEGGVLLWTVGTDVAKDHLFNRFKLTGGWGAMHYSAALEQAWFEGLLCERPLLRRKPGGGLRRVWEKFSHADRNEPLDLSVYNLALAHHLGLHRWSAADWQRLRARLVPVQITPDLFINAAPAEPAAAPPAHHAAQPWPAVPAVPTPDAPAAATPAAPPAPQPPPPMQPAPEGRRMRSRGLSR